MDKFSENKNGGGLYKGVKMSVKTADSVIAVLGVALLLTIVLAVYL